MRKRYYDWGKFLYTFLAPELGILHDRVVGGCVCDIGVCMFLVNSGDHPGAYAYFANDEEINSGVLSLYNSSGLNIVCFEENVW